MSVVCGAIKAKFHYTDPTGPARTRTDFFARPGPQTRISDKVRGLCLVGSGRARVVEFSYNKSDSRRYIHEHRPSVRRPAPLRASYDESYQHWTHTKRPYNRCTKPIQHRRACTPYYHSESRSGLARCSTEARVCVISRRQISHNAQSPTYQSISQLAHLVWFE